MKHHLLWFAAIGLALFCGASPAKDRCPPTAKPPSPEQMQAGLKNAKDRGALWKISKDGRSSYLFGTLHVGRLDWIFPGPKLQQALRETEVLAVEVDITDPNTQAEMNTATQAAAPLALTKQDQARLDAQADTACLPRKALATMHPIMQGITYALLAGRHDGMDAAFGQDLALLGFARAQQRPVVALESIALQMAVLLPKDPAEARKGFDRVMEELEKGTSRQQMLLLGQAWESGDLDTVGSLDKLCACEPSAEEREAMAVLNDDRNPFIATRVAQEHAKGKPLLVAVGLLHMTGPKALPKLLTEQGFAVERVAY